MSHTPSPRSKARTTRAKVAIRCDVTVFARKACAFKAALKAAWLKRRGSNEMCRLSGRHGTTFYVRPARCQHTIIARRGLDLYPAHPHGCRNMWTHAARVLRETPAIL